MNKYNTHSDLAKESLELLKEGKHYKRFIEKMDNFSIETYEFRRYGLFEKGKVYRNFF